MQVRRFFCGNPACVKTTFAEQIPGLTPAMSGGPAACRHCCKRSLVLSGCTGAPLTGRLARVVRRRCYGSSA